jgi:aspartate-semialdehyde dehydrogenase
MSFKHHLGIVGATGAVGRKILTVLNEQNIDPASLRLFASQRSAGTVLEYRGTKIPVESLESSNFKGLDVVFFSAGTEISLEYCPKVAAAGAIVVDNSNAFRMDANTPLVVPEVNPQDLGRHKGIIANPNCSTIQMVMAINPIHRLNPIRRIVVSTYQSVSGTGLEAIDILMKQSHAVLRHEEVPQGVYPHQIAFNLFPHIDIFLESGLSREEEKMVRETQKIMGSPIPVCPTTVRVPILYCHSEAVNLDLTNDFDLREIRNLLHSSPGLVVMDQPENNQYPTPQICQDKDEVFIGRLRRDPSLEHGLNMWVVSDNLRRGAATNAVLIYLAMARKNLL